MFDGNGWSHHLAIAAIARHTRLMNGEEVADPPSPRRRRRRRLAALLAWARAVLARAATAAGLRRDAPGALALRDDAR